MKSRTSGAKSSRGASEHAKPTADSNGTQGKRRVTFRVRATVGSVVCLAGDFNDWHPGLKPLRDKRGDGEYSTVLHLSPGDYQYKYVIDGTWCADPDCKEWVQNDHGTLNSVIHVS